MKRRTLDIVFALGGALVALLILALGFVLQNQANFATNYVHDQLTEQRITFAPAAALKAAQQGSCLGTYTGKPLVTGHEAECYANQEIGVDVTHVGNGRTYSQVSYTASRSRSNSRRCPTRTAPPPSESPRSTRPSRPRKPPCSKGRPYAGLLLTTYGFSVFGDRAQQAAWVCFGVALVLMLAAVAGLIHASSTPAEHRFTPHEA